MPRRARATFGDGPRSGPTAGVSSGRRATSAGRCRRRPVARRARGTRPGRTRRPGRGASRSRGRTLAKRPVSAAFSTSRAAAAGRRSPGPGPGTAVRHVEAVLEPAAGPDGQVGDVLLARDGDRAARGEERERVARARPTRAVDGDRLALRCRPEVRAPPCGRARRPVTGVRHRQAAVMVRSALPAVAPRSGEVATVTTARGRRDARRGRSRRPGRPRSGTRRSS